MVELLHGDCLERLQELPDCSVDAIVTDPPYFRVKGEDWDRQWDDAEQFIAWIGQLCEQWHRVLKPNGSLYVWASPKMAARVEVEISRRFNVLNRIRWVKAAGWHQKAEKEALRSYLSPWEECIFAEHYGADNIAKGEAGYAAKCDQLRGFLFEPLRSYLANERDRAGWTTKMVDTEWQALRASKGCMAGHWFGTSQWQLPLPEQYEWLRSLFNNNGGQYLRREYEDLRREYEDLRREYEDLRRPFAVSAAVPYTDVWEFPTVKAYPGKHPCEKPVEMLRHIINASTRPDAVVLDCFMGSGSTGEACKLEGRRFIGIERDPTYFESARRRLQMTAHYQEDLF
jgi:adenine-specific DNA-methyltransferase